MSERAAKAACFATFHLELTSKKFFKYFSFLYEKYHSLFMVDYPGPVTCPLECHPRMCPWTVPAPAAVQPHRADTELRDCHLPKIIDSREHSKALLSLSLTQSSSLGFWVKMPSCGRQDPWSIVTIKAFSGQLNEA